MIGCPETSVTNYQSTLHKIPEERRSQLSCYPLLTMYRQWASLSKMFWKVMMMTKTILQETQLCSEKCQINWKDWGKVSDTYSGKNRRCTKRKQWVPAPRLLSGNRLANISEDFKAMLLEQLHYLVTQSFTTATADSSHSILHTVQDIKMN
jgi:hypothetical protein